MEDMILFNGRSSTDFEMIVTEYPVLSRGVRRGDSYQIAGRNGTEVRENDTFENYTMTYKVAFPEDRGPSVTIAEIARWLLGSSGFCRLEDTFEPDFYRLARYAGPLNVSQLLDKCGEAPLAFDCQPERFLKTGEQAITLLENVDLSNNSAALAASKVVPNTSPFIASPIIRVSGSGNVGFSVENDRDFVSFEIAFGSSTDFVVEIDCETYDMNIAPELVKIGPGYPMLPGLRPGNNTFSATPYMTNPGTLTKLEIIPRWWTV